MQGTKMIGTRAAVEAALHAEQAREVLMRRLAEEEGARRFTVGSLISELNRAFRRGLPVVDDHRDATPGGSVVIEVCRSARVVVRTVRHAAASELARLLGEAKRDAKRRGQQTAVTFVDAASYRVTMDFGYGVETKELRLPQGVTLVGTPCGSTVTFDARGRASADLELSLRSAERRTVYLTVSRDGSVLENGVQVGAHLVYSVGYEQSGDRRVLGRRTAEETARMLFEGFPGSAADEGRKPQAAEGAVLEVVGRAA